MTDPKKSMANAGPSTLQPDAQSAISQERIEQTIRLRYSPFPELTMELLSRQLNQFRVGELRPAARTWEIMFERDGELSGPALKRFADASRLPWEIEKVEDSAEADAHAVSLQYFYTHLTATNVLEQNEAGGANLLFRQMMTAKAHRYSVHEILLRINNAAKREVTAVFNHTPVWFYENRRGYLAYLPGELDFWGQKLETGKWLAAVGEGLMRPCSIMYGIKHFALRDNMLFASRFGLPGIHGETDAAYGSKEWNDFVDSLKAFANDWITATNRGAKINLIEAAKGGSGTLPFQELIERADRGYAKMFRGGDLSTQSRDKEAVGASVQNDESTLLLEDDAQWLTDTCNARIDEPIIAYLFNAEPKAWLRVRVPKKPEADREINTLNAAGTLGIPVSIKTARERLQLPEPQAGDELIKINPAVANADSGKLDRTALGNSSATPEDAGHKFAMAVAADLLPVLKAADARLQRILTITDPALRKQKWDEAWAELEPLRTGILADPASGRVLEQISAQALADGLDGKEPATALGNFGQDQPRDSLGMWVDANGGGLSQKENLKRGNKAMDRAIRQKTDVQKAMHRKEVGQIDFEHGRPGHTNPNAAGKTHTDGYGISHIIAKHGEETARQLPEVLARGKITPHDTDPNKRYVEHGGSLAVLGRKNENTAYVVTSYEPHKK